MKVLVFSCLVTIATGASLFEKHHEKFQEFKLKHGKSYKDQAEDDKRFNIFKDKLREIEAHNVLYEQGLKSYKKGVNRFSDITREEFEAMLTLSVSNRPYFNATQHVKTGLPIPESVDWRTKGQVTEVKNQGACGSCWAFSVTGSIEAAYYRKTEQLVSLSEQQLVDCTTNINDGCNGGYLDQTFPWIQQYGLETEESYPYTGTDDKCKYPFSNIVTKVDGYKTIKAGDEEALRDAVANIGPISVGMDATYLDSYSGGIYEEYMCYPSRLNHGVLIVGYGYAKDYGEGYWIVKNSWGEEWGESGYFNILRDTNECGIAQDCAYPIIN